MSRRALDLSYKKFGRLTALVPDKKNNKRSWKCRCSCGNEVIVPTFQLTGGYTTSCGCKVLERGDITNKKFGKLTALGRFKKDKKNRRYSWICRCDCGNEIVTYSRYLRRGSRVDCGCGDVQRLINSGLKRRLPGNEVIINKAFDSYQRNAKAKNLQFDLSKEKFIELIDGLCYYCNEKPKVINGIDRLNNLEGYKLDNCVPCCKKCNYKKGSEDYYDFSEWITKVYMNLNKRNC